MLKDYSPKMKQFLNTEDTLEDSLDITHDITLLDEKSPFVVVVDSTGKAKVVRKSAICYVLSKDKRKLSSDRLQRVQEKDYALVKTSNFHNSTQFYNL